MDAPLCWYTEAHTYLLVKRKTHTVANTQKDIHSCWYKKDTNLLYKEGHKQFMMFRRTHRYADIKKDKQSCWYKEEHTQLPIYRTLLTFVFNRRTDKFAVIHKDTSSFANIRKYPQSCRYTEGHPHLHKYVVTHILAVLLTDTHICCYKVGYTQLLI